MPSRLFNMRIDEVAIITKANQITFGSGLFSAISSIAEWNWTAIIASGVAICGFATSLWFNIRRDRREAAESAARRAEIDARIASLKEGCQP